MYFSVIVRGSGKSVIKNMTDALFVRSDRQPESNALKNQPINPCERIVLMKKVKPDPPNATNSFT